MYRNFKILCLRAVHKLCQRPKGGWEGVRQMLTLPDKRGKGGLANADTGLQRAKTYSSIKSSYNFGNFGEILYLFGHSGKGGKAYRSISHASKVT